MWAWFLLFVESSVNIIGVFPKFNWNSVNSGNRINHWSMNWGQFKDHVSHMCLAGTVIASWFLISSRSSGQVGGARNMKSMWPNSAAIFFMTYFYRAGGGRGSMPPSAPLDPLLLMQKVAGLSPFTVMANFCRWIWWTQWKHLGKTQLPSMLQFCNQTIVPYVTPGVTKCCLVFR